MIKQLSTGSYIATGEDVSSSVTNNGASLAFGHRAVLIPKEDMERLIAEKAHDLLAEMVKQQRHALLGEEG